MEMALLKPGDSSNDRAPGAGRTFRRSSPRGSTRSSTPVPKTPPVGRRGTICLKNMSHGFVNNVNRSHLTPTLNACGVFIPIGRAGCRSYREKVVLHVVDAVKASYHGGPGAKPQFVLGAQDAVVWNRPRGSRQDRSQNGSTPSASAWAHGIHRCFRNPTKIATFLNAQVEHIEIAGMLGLGEFSDDKINVNRIRI